MKLFLFVVLLCSICSITHAQWNLNTSVRNPVCAVDSQQQHPAICTDGKGGAIIAWDDNRLDSIHTFIYAQRIDKYGYVQWQHNGEVVTNRFAGLQHSPLLASDGAGGAFVGWYDDSAGQNIYYDHLDSLGNLTWSAGSGILLAHDTSIFAVPFKYIGMFNDGQQGVFIVWDRKHYAPIHDSIFVSHINQFGVTVAPPILIFAFSQALGTISAASNSEGDVFVGVTAPSASLNFLFYLQKIGQNGTVQWVAPGIKVADTTASVAGIYLAGDQQGGVYAAWDQTTGGSQLSSYVAGIGSNGTVKWRGAHVLQSTTLGLASDDSGGVLVARDTDDGSNHKEISYVQRISPNGVSLWNGGNNGVVLNNNVPNISICSDSSGGAFAGWSDGADLFAMHIDANGNYFWPNNKTICNAAGVQSNLLVTQGCKNELIAAWVDPRNYGADENDIYAAKLGDPDLALQDTLLDFGRVNIGDTLQIARTGLVYNNGVELLSLTQMNLAGANANQFTIVNDTTFDTLTYGQHRDGVFSFHPNALGTDTADVVFTSNTKFPSPVYRLRGRGVKPVLTVIPGQINFGSVSIGQFHDSLVTSLIRNTGNGFLHVDSIIITGGGGQFTIDSGNTTPVVLDSGQTLTLKLRFTPVALNTSNATLQVYGNIPTRGKSTLVGNGVRGAMHAAEFIVDFGSVPVTIPSDTTIANFVRDTGSGVLHVLQTFLSGGDSAQFSIKSGGAPFTLATTKGQQFTLEFLPTSAGQKQTTLVITSDVPDTLKITLRGNGIIQQGKRNALLTLSASGVVFPDTVVGAHEDSILTAWIKNTGDTTLTVSAMSVTGANASEFSVDNSATSFSLDSGATQTITVHFSPVSVGTKTAQVQFTSNSQTSQVLLLQGTAKAVNNGSGKLAVAANLIDFGNVPVSVPQSQTKTGFVQNTGNNSLTVNRMNISGADAPDFTVTSSTTFTLVPAGVQDLTVQFIPGALGARTALLTIYSTAGDSVQVTLQGNGVNRSQKITASSYTIDMGKVATGQTYDSLLTQFIRNADTAAATITGVTFSGTDAASFSIVTPQFPLALAAQQSMDITARFRSVHLGVHNALATFRTSAGDSLQVAFTGTGIRQLDFSVGSAHGIPGAQVVVPITMDSTLSATNARQVTLQIRYNASQFYPLGVITAGSASAQWTFSPLAVGYGVLVLQATGTQPLAANSLFVSLQGEILASGVIIAPIMISNAAETGDTNITLGVSQQGEITTDSTCGYNGESFAMNTAALIVDYPAPNPAQANTLLQYWLPTSGDVGITVCDANGKIVWSATNQAQTAGQHQTAIDASALRSGIYMLRLSFNGESVTRRIVVQR